VAFSKARSKDYHPVAGRNLKSQQAFGVRSLLVLECFTPAALAAAAAAASDVDDGIARPTGQPVVTVGDIPRSNVERLPPAAAARTPTELLRDDEWRRNVGTGYAVEQDLVDRLDDPAELDTACGVAEALLHVVRSRFEQFIYRSYRFKKDAFRNAVCWKFMCMQLPGLCATAVVLGHVGTAAEVRARAEGGCLLATPHYRDRRTSASAFVPPPALSRVRTCTSAICWGGGSGQGPCPGRPTAAFGRVGQSLLRPVSN
jgi:hypothetical protein